MSSTRSLCLAGVLACSLIASSPPAAAQGNAKRAAVCPWCKNDPETMARAGLVSHGPIAIGPRGSAAMVESLPASTWIFLETAHLRWASSLGPQVVDLEERDRVQAELARLRAVLPSVPEKVKKLDPFLRLHLLAMRGEELYARFQSLLKVTDADFPETRTDGAFMGNGRFLGEKDKFELVLHASRATHNLFTAEFTGVQVTQAVRWHFPGVHKVLASIPAEDSDLREDHWLFPHVAHNLSHMFLCAYKHFSFDPPPWLDEGLALMIEKEIEPRSTTQEGEEGTYSDDRGASDWTAAARKLAGSGKYPPLAELMHEKTPGGLDQDAKYTSWSMVCFLAREHPIEFAKLLGGIKGQLDAQGYPSGTDLPGLQRKLFKELWGWSPAELEEQWKAWALRQQ